MSLAEYRGTPLGPIAEFLEWCATPRPGESLEEVRRRVVAATRDVLHATREVGGSTMHAQLIVGARAVMAGYALALFNEAASESWMHANPPTRHANVHVHHN